MTLPFDDADKVIFWGGLSRFPLGRFYTRITQHLYVEEFTGLKCVLFPIGGALMGHRIPSNLLFEIYALYGLEEREIKWLKLMMVMKTWPPDPAIKEFVDSLSLGIYGACFVPQQEKKEWELT